MVLITAPDPEVGARIARALVEERLAACVNVIGGMRSIYRWEGRIEDEAEVLLVAKTRAERVEPLEARLTALHPYEVPELVSLVISEGSRPYLEWLERETREVVS